MTLGHPRRTKPLGRRRRKGTVTTAHRAVRRAMVRRAERAKAGRYPW